MLYADLDQQAAYDLLIADGVLPDTPRRSDDARSPKQTQAAAHGCPAPTGGATPLYLLDSDVNLVWVQCGTCIRR